MTEKFGADPDAGDVLAGVDLKGKRFFVTGASSGIGLETARSLVSRGASVLGAVRNLVEVGPATASIRDAAWQGGGSLELIELDPASSQSVRACAARLLADGKPFDSIIVDAGAIRSPFGRTANGLEVQLATSCLGHFGLVGHSAAIRSGGLLFVAGQVGSREDASPEPDFERQVQRAFDNLKATLEGAGCDFDDIVHVTTFHTDREPRFETVMKVKNQHFSAPNHPTWTAIGVNCLAGFDFEIKAIARISGIHSIAGTHNRATPVDARREQPFPYIVQTQ